NIPRPYVEYTLKVLIEDEEDLDWRDNEPDKPGIRRVLCFFPAAPVQGPFLSLLRHDEDEGIRLVHGLTNRATEVWRTSMQTEGMLGTPLTPAPLALQLPSGEKTFWGDEHVYRWHRGTSVGPPAVVSSLMALEMWLEEQLESGRDAEELFAKVLAGSDSVAVLGVCASVSVFAPDRCLAAVLPLLSHPRLWRMDVARRANEAPGRPPISLPNTEALDRIRAQWALYSDKLHHAPMCPANHYHGQRAPTYRCTCGAVEAQKESRP
ncbi:MAG: hypothetical protein J0I06_28600, partial [Planctomycetes bacterium]|nr:hypothetical protein [Planctomycetota bacterium]